MLVLVAGCGGKDLTTVKSAPRPSATNGGFQADQPVVTEWVNLGTPSEVTPLQRTLQLNGYGGAIGQLLIKGVAGEPEIDRVQVEYVDKNVKSVELNKRFVPGDGQVIQLKEARPIEKIIVYTDPDSAGTFEIFGG